MKIEAARQSLVIELEGLTNGPGNQLVVDGINLGGVESRSGFARLHFVSDPLFKRSRPCLLL